MAICPECGSKRTKEAHSGFNGKEVFVIVRDRICKECGTEFTPPIPAWAPYLLVIAGCVIVLGIIGFGIGFILSEEVAQFRQPIRLAIFLLVVGSAGAFMTFKGVRMILGKDSGNTVISADDVNSIVNSSTRLKRKLDDRD